MPELEDPAYWQQNFKRNQAWLRPGSHTYRTQLPPQAEVEFRQWVAQNKVPFDPTAAVSDYDMRGFWAELKTGNPIAKSAVDPNDQQIHYPDYWKTPYSATFSNESQWANPALAPRWNGDQYTLPNGQVLWDDKAQKWVGPNAPWASSPDPAALLGQQQINVGTIKKMRGGDQLGASP